ncbi:MAG TPA: hypothetical protein VK911_13230 [Vicinamibacterales bacterium]|nr:hypothetical protein [Vicinamibacterales bacterium]
MNPFLQKPASLRHLGTDDFGDLGALFHRLNNELGIILSHAELLEAKASDDISRSRASQVVTSVLDAMGTARSIRTRVNDVVKGG